MVRLAQVPEYIICLTSELKSLTTKPKSLENNTSQTEKTVSLLRNDEREFFNTWWACWRSLNVCVLAPTLPSVRQRNPLYLPQVKRDRILTRVHTQIKGSTAGTGSLSEMKAGWPALSGAVQS